MPCLETTALIAGVLFFATLIRSTFGFGEAMIAVPLLALLLPVEVAAPVAALASITVASIIVLRDWRSVHLQSAWRLVAASACGIPLGLLLLRRAPEPVVKAILAAVILCFSLYSLMSRKPQAIESDKPAWIFGFAAGVLGGAYAMNGAPLVLYGSLRHWSPKQFRATLQGYFLPASLMVLSGYGFSGLLTRQVGRYYVASLPAILAAIFLGNLLHARIRAERFRSCVQIFLAIIGIVLLAQVLKG